MSARKSERKEVLEMNERIVVTVNGYDRVDGRNVSAPFENVDFRRNGVSFLTGQHTGVIQP